HRFPARLLVRQVGHGRWRRIEDLELGADPGDLGHADAELAPRARRNLHVLERRAESALRERPLAHARAEVVDHRAELRVYDRGVDGVAERAIDMGAARERKPERLL